MNLYSLKAVQKMIRNQKSLIFYERFRYKPLPVVQLLENFAICDKRENKGHCCGENTEQPPERADKDLDFL